jgi:hypothetical protein
MAPSGGSNEPIFKRPTLSPSKGFLNRLSMRKLQGTHKGCSQSNVQTATVTLYVPLGTNYVCAHTHTHTHTHMNTVLPHNYCLHWSICPNWKIVHQSPSKRNPCQVPEFTDHHRSKLITLGLLSCQRPLKRHKNTKLKNGRSDLYAECTSYLYCLNTGWSSRLCRMSHRH